MYDFSLKASIIDFIDTFSAPNKSDVAKISKRTVRSSRIVVLKESFFIDPGMIELLLSRRVYVARDGK